jgi:predicted permease
MLGEILSDLRFRVRALFRRAVVERELNDELRFHIEREVEKHVAAGVPLREAERRARLSFGGLDRIKDESRDARGLSFIEVFSQDLRYAARGLKATPGFTAAVVLTLGLGIGANAAMFRVVDRLLFRPPPYLLDPPATHRVYLQWMQDGKTRTDRGIQYTRYLDFQRATSSFDLMAVFATRTMAVGSGQDARELPVSAISASFFDFFSARPVIGRLFGSDEDRRPVGAPVVVLGHEYWRTQFGGRRDILGTRVQIGNNLCTIIGVAPRGFVGVPDGAAPAAFIPVTLFAGTSTQNEKVSDYYTDYHWNFLELLLRRRTGVDLAAASADLTQAYHQSLRLEETQNAGGPPLVLTQNFAVLGPTQLERGPEAGADVKVVTWVSGVALMVLLIAAANVGNLLLARAFRRRREIAVRLALGVSRARLVSQLLTETLMLAAAGGAAGLVFGQLAGRMLRTIFLPGEPALRVVDDPRTIATVVAITLLAGIAIGLVPIIAAGREDLAMTLKAGTRDGTYQRSRARSALLIVQSTLSVLLLIGAGLFVRSLHNVRSIRLGYDVDHLLYVSRHLRGARMKGVEQAAQVNELIARARAIPGVTGTARAVTVPFSSSWSMPVVIPSLDTARRRGVLLQATSPDYFATMGTRILQGRGLAESDREGAPPVAVISEAMSKRFWPGKSPIGQCFKQRADTTPCITVVGVAENIKVRSLTGESGLYCYLPIAQFHEDEGGVFVRTRGSADEFVETLRRQLQGAMPGASYVRVVPMHRFVDPQRQSWESGAKMFLAFGLLAHILAALGLYSVIAYNVAQRTHELGVRIALGAGGRHLTRLVVGQAMRFAVAGAIIGGMIALWAGRWIAPLLYETSPKDVTVFAVVIATLLLVAAAASAIPALRASRVDPNVALREG